MIRLLKTLLAGRGRGAAAAENRAREDGSASAATAERGRRLLADGVARFQAGDYAEAAHLFEQCLEISHDDAEAHLNLGITWKRLGKREEAADCFAMALHYRPEYAQAHFNCGVLDLEAGEFESAARRFGEAVRLNPQYAEAWGNLGLVQFSHLRRMAEAEASLRQALTVRPLFPDALCTLAMLRNEQGHVGEAFEIYDELLSRHPAMHEARLNRALLHLSHGNFARGWEDYEARKYGNPHFVERYTRFPEWDGSPAMDKTLLVYAEQGLGDEIMFASCLPEAMALVRHCVIDCSPKLALLFKRSFAAATVHGTSQTEPDPAWLKGAPAIDLRIAMGSLPGRFRPNEAAFPRHAGYLKADERKTAAWRERLARLGPGLKVGISWRGGTAKTRGRGRSLDLEQLMPLLRLSGARFVSLQYTDCHDELAQLRSTHGIRIEHWQDAIDDYDETAALVAALDLVISVQTAVVHLAGALGTACWAMVSVVPEWRYLTSGDRLPWYPSVRLFRQRTAGEWSDAIARIGVALQQRTAMTPSIR